MRKGQVVAIAVVAFLVATGVLVYLGRDTGTAAAGSAGSGSAIDAGAQGSGAAAGSGSDGGSGEGTASYPDGDGGSAPAVQRAESNVPTEAVADGENPPQFVIFAIDGTPTGDQLRTWMAAADPADARFTALLAAGSIDGDATVPDIGVLNKAYARGHDAGVYFNSAYCPDEAGAGDEADAAADVWGDELDAFDDAIDAAHDAGAGSDAGAGADGAASAGGGSAGPLLAFGADAITGGRANCLHGDLDAISSAWADHGMTYDASVNVHTGISWPTKTGDVWEFQVPYVYSPAFDRKVIPLNYTMWSTFNGAKDDPSATDQLTAEVRQTYDYLFDQAYDGNRAPVVIHYNAHDWADGAFASAALGLMADVCGKDDVYCATFADVAAWLGQQDPDVLASWQGEAVATGPSS